MTEDERKLEERKVKALEKISNSLDALAIWFEEIDKDEWSGRLQYYLSEFHRAIVVNGDYGIEKIINENVKKEKAD